MKKRLSRKNFKKGGNFVLVQLTALSMVINLFSPFFYASAIETAKNTTAEETAVQGQGTQGNKVDVGQENKDQQAGSDIKAETDEVDAIDETVKSEEEVVAPIVEPDEKKLSDETKAGDVVKRMRKRIMMRP